MQQHQLEMSFKSVSSVLPKEDELNQLASRIQQIIQFSSSDVLNIIRCVDLTSLKSIDTADSIQELISRTKSKLPEQELQVAALCVFQPFIEQCVTELKNKGIGVATVAGGFPHGQMDLDIKCADIKKSVELGATEIDVVINRGYVLEENWVALFQEIKKSKEVSGSAKLKVILATGELPSTGHIAKASWVSMLAGADFIKTSTGLEALNATIEAGFVMMRMIKAFHTQFGKRVGIKPAGGIRTTNQALNWWHLLHQELGPDWANPGLFRIGASGLLDDLIANIK